MSRDVKPIPVILDTDIGTDIDDTWALTMLLKSPELDARLIVSERFDTVYRAKIVARMLEIAERTDVPVGVGMPAHLEGNGNRQDAWVAGYDLASFPGTVREDGVGAIVETIMASPEPVTLICTGPLPNIAAALQREPRIAARSRFVGMHGSLFRQYDGTPGRSAECNVRHDAAACRKVFAADWLDAAITPIDTCGIVRLRGAKYQAVARRRDPLVQALMEQYRNWRQQTRDQPADASSRLFDTVAVYLAFSSDLLVMKRMGVRVTDDGYTVPDPHARAINCALEWKDLAAFEDLLVERLTGGRAETSEPLRANGETP